MFVVECLGGLSLLIKIKNFFDSPLRWLVKPVSGGYGGGVTPVPIPNTEVKPACADGTWDVGPWESRSLPDFFA